MTDDPTTPPYPPQNPDEPGIADTHYTVDPTTGKITFNKDETYYRIERDVFKSHGYDIDACNTFEEYFAIWRQLKGAIFDVVCARILSRPATNLDKKWLQAFVRGDNTEMKRLSALAKRRAKLKVIDSTD